MSRSDRAALIRLADSATEGHPVDWQKEKATEPELAPILDCLAVVERIARGYRTIGETAELPRAAARKPRGRKRAPDRAAPEPASLFAWGPLRALERIGAGSFGDVYRAHDPSLDREVALKLVRDGAATGVEVDRFLLEARRLARVRHPNVLIVHGADRHDGRAGMWAELIRGRTLEQLLADQGPFGAEEAGHITIEVCRALAAVHAAGLVHRDIKTANVMRESGGRIVLMDFGAVGELTATGALDAGEAAVGTPLLMAPELLRGEPASPASDLYALGAFAYRLLTAAYPVEALSLEELRARHRNGERVALRERRPDLPSRFVQAVEAALAADPAARYHGPGAMERALAESLGLAPGPAGRSEAPGAEAPVGLVLHNLPETVTSFFDGKAVLDECSGLLDEAGWLTLVGPGGSGKTRLALRLAETHLDAFPDGVWYADLEGLGDRDGVARAVAAAMGLPAAAGPVAERSIVEHLRAATALIVLDHADASGAALASLSAAWRGECPGITVLATSRQPLGLAGERTRDVAERISAAAVPPEARDGFVGRVHELAALEAALERARRRAGATLLVSGEAGMGKTHLLAEFRARAEARGLVCLAGRCSWRGGRNFEPFVEALEEFARRLGARRTEPARATGGADYGTLFAALDVLVDPRGRSAPEPASREHVWFLIDTLLKKISRYETLVLMLDDLHWADEGTLALLHHVTRILGGSRLLIVGAYRSEELGSGDAALENTLALLAPLPAFARLPLPPLDREETRALVDRTLGAAAGPRAWTTAIHDHAQGNPFFTVEIVRDVESRGAVRGPGDDGGAAHALPQTVADVIARRLARLAPEERDLLEVAAIEGETFRTDTLAAALDVARVAVLKRLRGLQEIHQLVRPAEGGHRFGHGLIREALLRGMPAELRREYHALVADHWIRVRGERPEHAGGIGEHLIGADRLAEAVPYLLAAGREARRLFLYDRALTFLDRALELTLACEDPDAAAGELHRARCEVLLLVGRPLEARQAAEQSMEIERRRGGAPAPAALESLGDAALAQGDLVAAEGFLSAARERYATSRALGPVARCDWKLGATATRRGDFDRGLERLQAALACAQDAGDPREPARIRLDIGDVLVKLGRFDEALATFETAVADVRGADQRHDLIRGLTKLGNARFQSGHPDPALEHYTEALGLARGLGDLQGIARLEANIGNVHLVRGDAERALVSYAQALASFEAIGDLTGVAQTLMALGNACFTRGEFDAAAGHYERSLEPRETTGDRWGLANALDNLGVAEYQLGRWTSALAHHEAALRHRTDIGDRLGCAESALALGAVLAVTGDRAAAERRFDEARAVAAALGDEKKQVRAALASACLAWWNGETGVARERVASAATLAVDEPAFRARRTLWQGLFLSESHRDDAEAALRASLEEAIGVGSVAERATARLALAELLARHGRLDDAEACVKLALDEIGLDRVPLLELHGLQTLEAIERARGGSEAPRGATRARIEALAARLSPAGPAVAGITDERFPLP